jgi:hypothetical protein
VQAVADLVDALVDLAAASGVAAMSHQAMVSLPSGSKPSILARCCSIPVRQTGQAEL